MRFIHVTDSHIAPDPAFTNYGHAPHANLVAVVDAINALPFPVDFVLHSGDVVQDRSEAAYRLAGSVLSRLRLPVRYVAGNHDDADILQRVLLGRSSSGPRFDSVSDIAGVLLAVFDSRGPNDPSGTLTDAQLADLHGSAHRTGLPLSSPSTTRPSRWTRGGSTKAGRCRAAVSRTCCWTGDQNSEDAVARRGSGFAASFSDTFTARSR